MLAVGAIPKADHPSPCCPPFYFFGRTARRRSQSFRPCLRTTARTSACWARYFCRFNHFFESGRQVSECGPSIKKYEKSERQLWSPGWSQSRDAGRPAWSAAAGPALAATKPQTLPLFLPRSLRATAPFSLKPLTGSPLPQTAKHAPDVVCQRLPHLQELSARARLELDAHQQHVRPACARV